MTRTVPDNIVRFFPEPPDHDLEELREGLGASHLALYLYLEEHPDDNSLHDLLAHLERVVLTLGRSKEDDYGAHQ